MLRTIMIFFDGCGRKPLYIPHISKELKRNYTTNNESHTKILCLGFNISDD